MIIKTLTAAFHLQFNIEDECGCSHPHDILFEIPGLELTPEQIVDIIEVGIVGSEYEWQVVVIPDIAKALRRAADPQKQDFMISDKAPPCTIMWGCEEPHKSVDIYVSIDLVDGFICVDEHEYGIGDFYKFSEDVIRALERRG
jgi:hypothetical protein